MNPEKHKCYTQMSFHVCSHNMDLKYCKAIDNYGKFGLTSRGSWLPVSTHLTSLEPALIIHVIRSGKLVFWMVTMSLKVPKALLRMAQYVSERNSLKDYRSFEANSEWFRIKSKATISLSESNQNHSHLSLKDL